MRKIFIIIFMLSTFLSHADTKHTKTPFFETCNGKIVTGYQGWFRAHGDDSKQGWVHWGSKGKFNPENCTIDVWPDTSEYKKIYNTDFKYADGENAKVFSSIDAETLDLHFKWMKEYGIDAAFVQRFYAYTTSKNDGSKIVLKNALSSAQKYKIGLMVMYDISGMPSKNVAEGLIADWKNLVDEINITRGKDSPYVFHNGKPLVCIWGIGFNDRDYSPKTSDIIEFIEFLRNDKEYGNCSIMIGVPTYWRTLSNDSIADKDFHSFLKKYADIISPWNVGRYQNSENIAHGNNRLIDNAKGDIEWCSRQSKDYMPVIYPGFSWYNLMRTEGKDVKIDSIPREEGKFFWNMACQVIDAGSKMIYVAMFDEVDEGTAIFKLSSNPPSTEKCPFLFDKNVSEDHYLFLAGKMKDMLKSEKSLPFPRR